MLIENKTLQDNYQILKTNVIRLMEINGISKFDLVKNKSLSLSSVYKALDQDFRNLRLSSISALAEALDVPLFILFIDSNSEEWQAIYKLAMAFKGIK